MAELRFFRHSCLLSNQKAALAIHLSHHILTGEPPSTHLGTSVSPSTISEWNVLLGEVDKAVLREKLSAVSDGVYVFADDSNKRGEDRHMVGLHVWSEEENAPTTFVLANT